MEIVHQIFRAFLLFVLKSAYGLSKAGTTFYKIIRPGVCVELSIVHTNSLYIRATVKCQAVSYADLTVNAESDPYELREGSREKYEQLMQDVFYKCGHTARMVDGDLVPFQYEESAQRILTKFEGEDLSFENGKCQPDDHYAPDSL